jgi:hypothetical protein
MMVRFSLFEVLCWMSGSVPTRHRMPEREPLLKSGKKSSLAPEMVAHLTHLMLESRANANAMEKYMQKKGAPRRRSSLRVRQVRR